MKTLGRILIIVAAFVLVMGIMYVIVNANSSSTASPAFERGEGAFPRSEGMQPRFRDGERPDFDRDGPRGGGWTFGLVKNIGIIAIIVALIALPKSFIRSIRRKTVSAD